MRDMNDTQWVMEWESLQQSEQERFEDIRDVLDATKRMLIGIYGLDLMPVEDQETGLLSYRQDGEFIPMSLLISHREWLKELGEKMDDFYQQEEARLEYGDEYTSPQPMTLTDLEEIEQAESEDGDIMFADDPEALKKFLVWNSPESKWIRENIIVTEDDGPQESPVEEESEEGPERHAARRITIEDG